MSLFTKKNLIKLPAVLILRVPISLFLLFFIKLGELAENVAEYLQSILPGLDK